MLWTDQDKFYCISWFAQFIAVWNRNKNEYIQEICPIQIDREVPLKTYQNVDGRLFFIRLNRGYLSTCLFSVSNRISSNTTICRFQQAIRNFPITFSSSMLNIVWPNIWNQQHKWTPLIMFCYTLSRSIYTQKGKSEMLTLINSKVDVRSNAWAKCMKNRFNLFSELEYSPTSSNFNETMIFDFFLRNLLMLAIFLE